MGEYLFMLAVIIFIGGLVTIVYQSVNHKFPSHKKHLTNHSA